MFCAAFCGRAMYESCHRLQASARTAAALAQAHFCRDGLRLRAQLLGHMLGHMPHTISWRFHARAAHSCHDVVYLVNRSWRCFECPGLFTRVVGVDLVFNFGLMRRSVVGVATISHFACSGTLAPPCIRSICMCLQPFAYSRLKLKPAHARNERRRKMTWLLMWTGRRHEEGIQADRNAN